MLGLNSKFYHAALIIYCLIIFIFSSIPGQNLPNVNFQYIDKFVHIFIYAILFVLFFYSLKSQTKYVKLQKFSLSYSLLFTAIYGLTDEIHQYFVTNRSCEFADWVADIIGALIMFSLIKFVYGRKKDLIVTTLALITFAGCSGSNNSSENFYIILESAEVWVDQMPIVGMQPPDRFHFNIKLIAKGQIADTNFTIKNFKMKFDNNSEIEKTYTKRSVIASDSLVYIDILNNTTDRYLPDAKNIPEEVKFSFSVHRNGKNIKTFNTPNLKIGRTY